MREIPDKISRRSLPTRAERKVFVRRTENNKSTLPDAAVHKVCGAKHSVRQLPAQLSNESLKVTFVEAGR